MWRTRRDAEGRGLSASALYAVVDDALSPDFPLGDAIETFIRRENAERFIEEVRGDDPEAAAKLRIEDLGGRRSSSTRV